MRPPWTLPPLDFALSPHTGYTRDHWVAVADGLLGAAAAYASPSGALITPPGRPSWSGVECDGLEGFARTFLLASLRVAGHGGADPTGLIPRYAAGLAAGVTSGHAEAWPAMQVESRQALVEAASLSVGLHVTKPWLWDLLDDVTRQQVVAWMGGAFSLDLPDNNWHLFRVLVGAFLESVGAAHDHEVTNADLARIDDFWVGDGWYRDGGLSGGTVVGDNFDHYCGWAMHTYPALIDLVNGPRPFTRTARARLRRFLEDFVHLVGANGAPLHQGRSLIYRFAAAAAPWAGALTGCTPLSPGQTRRLASGMLRHFVDHGFTGVDGIPTLGWYDAFPPMVQPYSAPASPFWLSKAFLGLLLPADHPCWTAVEEPLPAESRDQCRPMPAPGWLVTSTAADGVVRVANHGSDGFPPLFGVDDPGYARLAYSTATGPVVGTPDAAGVADNHVGLHDPARGLTRRTRIHRLRVTSRLAASWHEPLWPDGTASGAVITSTSVPSGPWEVRVHVVSGAAGAELREFGWQVAGNSPVPEPVTDPPGVAVRRGGLESHLLRLTGGRPGVARLRDTSAFGTHSAVPFVACRVDRSRAVVVTLVALGRTVGRPPDVSWLESDLGVRLTVDGCDVDVPAGPGPSAVGTGPALSRGPGPT